MLLVWEDPLAADQIILSMLVLGPGASAGKGAPNFVLETEVSGARAIWLEGDHFLILETGEGVQPVVLMVKANVLIWDDQELTFRLEGDFKLEEMIRIAESIR